MLDLIDQLPSASRLGQAVMDDPDAARALAVESDRPRERWSPQLREWDLDAALLAEIRDRLGEVAQGIAALGGAKPRRVKPFPRPVTEVDRLRERSRQEAVRDLIKELGG